MNEPTKQQIEQAIKAAESLHFWLQRIAEKVALEMERRAMELRKWN